MDWWLILIILVGLFFFLLAIGMPVAFAFLFLNILGALTFMSGSIGLRQLILSIYNSLTSFTLAPVPLFVLMGEILFHSGMALKTINVLDKWLGQIPGRLGLLTIAGGTIFSNLSGSTMANTAMLGSLLVPEMTRRGYSKSMSLGPILGTGGIAMIIPPSALAIILGTLARISIGSLLIAGIIPGVIMALTYSAYILLRCRINPSSAPSYKVTFTSLYERIKGLLKYVLPLTSIVFLVVGLIFLGVSTPTEAAALGALGSLLLAFLYKGMSYKVMKKSIQGTLQVTVMTFMIIAGSIAFSQILAFTGASQRMVDSVIQLSLPPLLLLVVMQMVLFILGAFMDQISMMMISIPLYMPLVQALGFNPIWFGIIMLINLEIAFTSPPFGLLLFVMKGVAPRDTTMGDIYKAAFPFILCDLIVMAFLILFPGLVLWLPNLMK
jgi:tripartite ATP-independent transporter DctM subunit